VSQPSDPPPSAPPPANAPASSSPASAKRLQPSGLQAEDLDALRREIDARIAEAMPERWNPNPDEVRKAVMKLVLTLAEFIRQLLERQAIRRMENDTLTPEQIEAVGVALMRIEEAVHDIARQNDLDPKDLNLDLGPLGRLL
jgi:hypothetical protein